MRHNDISIMPRRAPNIENRTVAIRAPNKVLRTREYLTPGEVKKLMTAARKNRNGHRDATMILVAYRHGLRATEVCQLRWDQYDLKRGTLHVNRIKIGIESVHPVGGEELRALRKLLREEPENRYVFVSERGAPLSHEGFLKLVKRAGVAGKLPFSVHPHMLRHACGYKLANEGTTLVPSSSTWDIGTSRTPSGTPSYRRAGSRIFGAIRLGARFAESEN